MRDKLESFIKEFVRCFNEKPEFAGTWGEPIFAYADARDPLFPDLKRLIGEHHKLPEEIMPDGRTVAAYFIPVSESIAASNAGGRYASREWAAAYLSTIDLIKSIENGLEHYMGLSGWKISKTADHRSWDPQTMRCDWSHRHAAYIAGLGTFGLNRGLITEKGVCGRIGTFITDACIEPTPRPETEYCLFKLDGSCGICVTVCPIAAIDLEGNYDNKSCMAFTEENAKFFESLGYADVCAKCMSGMPCAVERP